MLYIILQTKNLSVIKVNNTFYAKVLGLIQSLPHCHPHRWYPQGHLQDSLMKLLYIRFLSDFDMLEKTEVTAPTKAVCRAVIALLLFSAIIACAYSL